MLKFEYRARQRAPHTLARLWMGCWILALGLVVAGCGSDETNGSTPGPEDAQTSDADASAPDAADTSEEADTAQPDAADTDDTQEPMDPLPPRPWSVTAPGPYRVGFIVRNVTYQAEGVEEPRTLRLAIWYPTLDTEGHQAVYYNLINRPEALKNASVALSEPAPLLVFSHGNAAMAEQSYFMTEFFASHGWVVASPDHTGNTLVDTVGAIDLTTAVFRPQDISAVLDFMLNLDGEEPLAGLIHPDQIVMSGHSFGGFTTLANAGAQFSVDELLHNCETNREDMCEILEGHEEWQDIFRQGYFDSRIKAAIPQAPGGYQAFLEGLKDIQVPTLLFTAGMDITLKPHKEGDPIWQTMQGAEHLRVNLPTAGHFSFSNLCDVLGDGIPMLRDDGCGPDFMDPQDAYAIVNAYALSFARNVLFQDASTRALLEGHETPWRGLVQLRRKPATP